MNRALIVAALLVVLGGAYVFLTRGDRTPAPDVSNASSGAVQITTATEHEETDTYILDAKYPQFGIPAIDADIKSKIDAAIAEFKALPPNPPESATPKNEFTGAFENAYVGPDVVSVKLVLSQYTGGAHPMTIFSGLNYDRAGRQLLQDDAFTMVGMTVGEVSARATIELKRKLGDTMFEEGANTNPENFSSFVISADKVTFIFQPYQVAPYAAGPQEISFERKQ